MLIDDELKMENLTSLLVSRLASNSVLGDTRLRTEKLASLLVSILDSSSVLIDGEPETKESTSLLVSISDSSSLMGDNRLRTEELTSLVVRTRSSLMDVLKTSGADEGTALLDESGMSIGVVTGAGILLVPRVEAGVPKSLLVSCVELTRSELEIK